MTDIAEAKHTSRPLSPAAPKQPVRPSAVLAGTTGRRNPARTGPDSAAPNGRAAGSGPSGKVASPPAPWSLDDQQLQRAMLSDAQAGLSTREARRRLRTHGLNTTRTESADRWPRLLARQFASPLVLILVFGACVSAILRDWSDSVLILAIVCGSAAMAFTQETRAAIALGRLRRRLALKATVLRDGVRTTVPASEVVPGDVVLLKAGHLVPADARVLEATDLLVVEASLTGESLPVEKRPGVVAADLPLSQRTNCVFAGTSVRSGTARVLVTATGTDTAFGAVAAALAARSPETAFAHGLRRFGELLLRIMLIIVLFALAANQWLGRPVVESLMFAVALAVGLSPELLPAVVTVTLSQRARATVAWRLRRPVCESHPAWHARRSRDARPA